MNKLKKMSNVVGIVTLILVFNVIAFVPITSAALANIYCESCQVTAHQVGLMSALMMPNMICNIIIYFVKSKEFKKLLPKVCRNNQVNP